MDPLSTFSETPSPPSEDPFKAESSPEQGMQDASAEMTDEVRRRQEMESSAMTFAAMYEVRHEKRGRVMMIDGGVIRINGSCVGSISKVVKQENASLKRELKQVIQERDEALEQCRKKVQDPYEVYTCIIISMAMRLYR